MNNDKDDTNNNDNTNINNNNNKKHDDNDNNHCPVQSLLHLRPSLPAHALSALQCSICVYIYTIMYTHAYIIVM